jgi:hypothetical protein
VDYKDDDGTIDSNKNKDEELQMAGVAYRERVNRNEQLRYLGHILRENGLERESLLGMIKKRTRQTKNIHVPR